MSRVDAIDSKLILSCFDDAMQQTFETYFFMEATPLPLAQNTLSLDEKDSLEVELVFKGPFSGHLHLQVSIETALALISTLPIPFQEVNDAILGDLFAEITNTIGGRIASALAGDDFAFDLTIPEVLLGKAPRQQTKDAARCYQTDFGVLLVSVSQLTENKIPLAKGA